jgi:hypothetical protein
MNKRKFTVSVDELLGYDVEDLSWDQKLALINKRIEIVKKSGALKRRTKENHKRTKSSDWF